MKRFDWSRFLARHPLFGMLEPTEIEHLLDDHLSQEREYDQDQVILREGEIGNSLFLIGSGEVAVILRRENGTTVPITALSRGEIFGEMAVLEHKPRSATVTATQKTTVLEIDGEEILKILTHHPDLEFKLMVLLSERLRQITDEVVRQRIHDLGSEFAAVQSNVDNELALARNLVKMSEATLATTNQRISEINERARDVIDSTNRNNERLFQAVKTVGIIGVPLVLVLGILGYNTVQDVRVTLDEINAIKSDAQTAKLDAQVAQQEAESTREKIALISEKTKETADEMEVIKRDFVLFAERFEPKFYKLFVVEQALWKEIENNDLEEAEKTFRALMELTDLQVKDYVFKSIMQAILQDYDSRSQMKKLLYRSFYKSERFAVREQFLIHYLLASAHIIDGEMYHVQVIDKSLTELARRYSGSSIKGTLTEDFTPQIFQAYFEQDIIQERISKITQNSTGGTIGENQIDEILEDETIGRIAYEKADKIREVWRRLP